MKFGYNIGPEVSEEKSFENVDGRTTEPVYNISFPGAFGSCELKKDPLNTYLRVSTLFEDICSVMNNDDIEVFFKLYLLQYADDTVIFAESPDELQVALEEWNLIVIHAIYMLIHLKQTCCF